MAASAAPAEDMTAGLTQVVNDNLSGADREGAPAEGSEADRALVTKILAKIQADSRHHRRAFKRMIDCQNIALRGATKDWAAGKYVANLIGRHISQKAATLYAKNPTAQARRRERLDFEHWDESKESLALAFQIVQDAQAAMAAMLVPPEMPPVDPLTGSPMMGHNGGPALDAEPAPPVIDPLTGQPMPSTTAPAQLPTPGGAPLPEPVPPANPGIPGGAPMGMDMGMGPPPPPEFPAGMEQAVAVLEDFQRGMAARDLADKHGKTLEILFHHFLAAGSPQDIKAGLKAVVRRAATCGVGYVQLDYQRTTGPSPSVAGALEDRRGQLARLQALQEKDAEGEVDADDAEMAEIQASIAALEAMPQVTREGPVFDFPGALDVIPDRITKDIVGFIGARHISIRRLWTPEKVKEDFGIDVKGAFKPFRASLNAAGVDGMPGASETMSAAVDAALGGNDTPEGLDDTTEMCCVYQHFDKMTGLYSVVCDGYPDFLARPGPPPVDVPGFWNVYALTFNPIEHESQLFPRSDVELMLDQQAEYNRAREGLRQHRRAALPRFVFPNGVFEPEDIEQLRTAEPFEAIGINIDPTNDVAKILQQIPMRGVDPNLYETNQILTDMQLVVGTSEANLGATGNGTATEASIALGAQQTAQGSNVDDMDAFLTRIARDTGRVMQMEMSAESVKRIVGPGAAWPDMDPRDLADEIGLEIKAGSSGKPNAAAELNAWKTLLPILVQLPGIDPEWLARESISRLDDKADLTKAIAKGVLSVVAQNRMAMTAPGDAGQPDMQGGAGGANAPVPPGTESPGGAPTFGGQQTGA